MKPSAPKEIPFYPNHPDNMHCMLAAYKSIFDYFENKKLSWEELEELTGFENGRAAWTVKALTAMAKGSYDIKMVEPFDYGRYVEEGVGYLKDLFSPEKLEWMLEHSNILEMPAYIPDFLKAVRYECRSATNDDIAHMLSEGRLVFVTLDSRTLNDETGYSDHAVLIIDEDGEDFIMHDPGYPPQPYRRVSKAKLHAARGGDGATGEVTGFKLKQTNS